MSSNTLINKRNRVFERYQINQIARLLDVDTADDSVKKISPARHYRHIYALVKVRITKGLRF